MLSTFRQNLIEMLIAEEGGRCRYCRIEVRRNWADEKRQPEDATVDHIVPRAKGGTNARKNLALCCRACNNAKGDRDAAAFLADPRPERERKAKPIKRKVPRRRGIRYVPVPQPLLKVGSGTLAAAILSGEVTEHGTYRKRPTPEPARRIPAPKMTALETARWLRDSARKNGQKWPLA